MHDAQRDPRNGSSRNQRECSRYSASPANAHEQAGRGAAGVRTFTLIALAGAISERMGGVGIAIVGGFTALAALAS